MSSITEELVTMNGGKAQLTKVSGISKTGGMKSMNADQLFSLFTLPVSGKGIPSRLKKNKHKTRRRRKHKTRRKEKRRKRSRFRKRQRRKRYTRR